MKNKITLLLILLLNHAISQTFRNGFDNRDFSSSGGNSQGASYYSNVSSKLHNDESVFLIGYMNMFVATRDKKYSEFHTRLDQLKYQKMVVNNFERDSIEKSHSKKSFSFGLNVNYLFPDFYTDDPYRVSHVRVTLGANLLFNYSINRYFNIHSGISLDYFETRANVPATNLNSYISSDVKSKYSFFTFPLLYSLNLFEDNRTFNLSPCLGGAAAFLLSNETEVNRSNGEFIVKNWFEDYTASLFFALGLKSSFQIKSKLELFTYILVHRQITPMISHSVSTTGILIEEKQWLGIVQSQIGISYKW